MNDKDLKKLYGEYAKNSAPDLDKLWNRIEESIDNKTEVSGGSETAEQTTKTKIKTTKRHYGRWISLAACAALAIVGARYLGGDKTAVKKSGTDNNNNYHASENAGREPVQAAEYSSLSFGYSKANGYGSYQPDGDEYFVESDVLKQTEFFLDCEVEKADLGSQYGEYKLRVINVLCLEGEEIDIGDEIVMTSRTPYLLNEGGEYLLPMRESNGEYEIVFENAPQIEFTRDGKIVFHNGWSAMAEGSAECVYPSGGIDDFFYDRMRIAYTDSINDLLARWQEEASV